MSILIICEHDHKVFKPANLNVISAALGLNLPIDFWVLGHVCDPVVERAAQIPGLRTILQSQHENLADQGAERMADVIAEKGQDYQYIMVSASTFGKNLMPRVAALLDKSHLSDVMAIQGSDVFVCPIYAGNAISTVQSFDDIKIMTVRTTAFSSAPVNGGQTPLKNIDVSEPQGRASRLIERLEAVSSRPELTAARIVVSGGRGVQSKENFKLIEDLADTLGAGVGASRAAVDAGYVPNDYQVGQTGKIVAPELYIAVGLSGAIQHLAGMKDSKIIVAINKDPEAPIFQVADYGLVGDLFDIVPALITAFKQLRT